MVYIVISYYHGVKNDVLVIFDSLEEVFNTGREPVRTAVIFNDQQGGWAGHIALVEFIVGLLCRTWCRIVRRSAGGRETVHPGDVRVLIRKV